MAIRKENSGCSKMFACPVCDELCESKVEAKSHCIDEIRVVFTCDDCSEEFDDRSLAKACCPEWVCSDCGDGVDGPDSVCECS